MPIKIAKAGAPDHGAHAAEAVASATAVAAHPSDADTHLEAAIVAGSDVADLTSHVPYNCKNLAIMAFLGAVSMVSSFWQAQYGIGLAGLANTAFHTVFPVPDVSFSSHGKEVWDDPFIVTPETDPSEIGELGKLNLFTGGGFVAANTLVNFEMLFGMCMAFWVARYFKGLLPETQSTTAKEYGLMTILALMTSTALTLIGKKHGTLVQIAIFAVTFGISYKGALSLSKRIIACNSRKRGVCKLPRIRLGGCLHQKRQARTLASQIRLAKKRLNAGKGEAFKAIAKANSATKHAELIKALCALPVEASQPHWKQVGACITRFAWEKMLPVFTAVLLAGYQWDIGVSVGAQSPWCLALLAGAALFVSYLGSVVININSYGKGRADAAELGTPVEKQLKMNTPALFNFMAIFLSMFATTPLQALMAGTVNGMVILASKRRTAATIDMICTGIALQLSNWSFGLVIYLFFSLTSAAQGLDVNKMKDVTDAYNAKMDPKTGFPLKGEDWPLYLKTGSARTGGLLISYLWNIGLFLKLRDKLVRLALHYTESDDDKAAIAATRLLDEIESAQVHFNEGEMNALNAYVQKHIEKAGNPGVGGGGIADTRDRDTEHKNGPYTPASADAVGVASATGTIAADDAGAGGSESIEVDDRSSSLAQALLTSEAPSAAVQVPPAQIDKDTFKPVLELCEGVQQRIHEKEGGLFSSRSRRSSSGSAGVEMAGQPGDGSTAVSGYVPPQPTAGAGAPGGRS